MANLTGSFPEGLSRCRAACWAGLLLWLALAGIAAGELLNPFPADRLAARTLPNGLRILVLEDHALPIVSVVVTIRGGSGTQDARGAAHYLEHLVLQGSAHYPDPLAPQLALEEAGAVTDAVTSRDMMRFQATAPSAQTKLLVDVLADVALHPVLDDEAFARERPTILAEIQQAGDDPRAALLHLGYLHAYRAHPYRYRPTGSIEDILRLTVADVRAYHDRWFVPNNMSVTLVGDITPMRAVALCTAAFGPAKAATLPPWPANEPGAAAPAERWHEPDALSSTWQVLAFAAPTAADPGSAAADVAMTLLVDGDGALLPAQWTQDGVTVYDSGGEFVTARGAGRWLIWAATPPEMAEAWRASTLRLLTRLAAAPLPADTLAPARVRLAGQLLADNESYTQQAATLAFHDGVGGGIVSAAAAVPTVLAVTPEQVRAVMPTRPLAVVSLGAKIKEGR